MSRTPFRTSHPTRPIESVISMPTSVVNSPHPRHRIVSQPRAFSMHEQVPLAAYGITSSSPPTRSLMQIGRGPTTPHSTFEPRVIRADTAHSADIACPSSVSPPRTRRPSGPSAARAQSNPRPSVPRPSPNMETVSFPRPAYLCYSALYQQLQTETPPSLPHRRAETVGRPDHSSGAGRSQRSPSVDSDDDDMSPPPRELRKTPPPVMSTSLPSLLLPTRWCEEYRSSLLTVSGDGRDLTYQQGASSSSDKDAATARTVVPVPSACGIYYFEIEVAGKAQKSRVSIGFVGREVKVSRLPGWERNSWGYHGENGTVCSGDKSGTTFGSAFGVGDTIGCGVDFSQNRVFYTKNGSLLGTVFDNVGKDCEIYPAVGLCYSGESIRANFGQEPFKYDIENHVLQQRNQTWAKIQSTPLRWPNQGKPDEGAEADLSIIDEHAKTPINELVLTYLSHHGYARTARAFEASCTARGGLPTSASPKAVQTSAPDTLMDDHVMDMDMGDGRSTPASTVSKSLPTDGIEIRTRIVQAVIAGDIDTALAQSQEHFPLVLEAEAGIMLFKLRCRKFVELVLEAAELKKKMQAEGRWNPESASHIDTLTRGSRSFGDGMDMDVDDDGLSGTGARHLANGYGANEHANASAQRPSASTSASTGSAAATAAQYGPALEKAVEYGRELESDYKHRSEIRAMFKRICVIMAFYDPLEDAAEVAGQPARVALATELNQAILQSQGRPAQPLLDRLYRQTAVCLTQLALMGNGAAAFADMQKELLET